MHVVNMSQLQYIKHICSLYVLEAPEQSLKKSEAVCINTLQQLPFLDPSAAHPLHAMFYCQTSLILPIVTTEDQRCEVFKRKQAALTKVGIPLTIGDPAITVAYGAVSIDHSHHGNHSAPFSKMLRRLQSIAWVHFVDNHVSFALSPSSCLLLATAE